jgi:hypothetical protein
VAKAQLNSNAGGPGGSGGGGALTWQSTGTFPGGSGNTPPVSPPQGANGGSSGTQGAPNLGSGGGAGGGGPSGSQLETTEVDLQVLVVLELHLR